MESEKSSKIEKQIVPEKITDNESYKEFKNRSDALRSHIFDMVTSRGHSMELYDAYNEEVINFSGKIKAKYPVPEGIDDYSEGYGSYIFYHGLIMSTPPIGAKNLDFPDPEFSVVSFVEKMYAKYWPEYQERNDLTKSPK